MRVPLTTAAVSPVLRPSLSPQTRSTGTAFFAENIAIEVLVRGTDDQADVYAVEEGGSPVDQPLRTDHEGRIETESGEKCWVEEGSYDLSVGGTIASWEANRGDNFDPEPEDDKPAKLTRGTAPRNVTPMVDRDEWWAGDFGMKFSGDEETDDFETAAEESRAAGKTLRLPDGVTAITSTQTFSDTADPLRIVGSGRGATVIEHGVHNAQLFAPAGTGLTAVTKLSAPAAVGASEITVESTSGLQAGDYLILRSKGEAISGGEGEFEEVEGGTKNITSALGGDIVRVREVKSGTVLVLSGILNWAYAAESDVRLLNALDRLLFADFTIKGELGSNTSAAARGFSLNYVTNATIRNLGFEYLDGPGIYTQWSDGLYIDSPDFLDMREDTTNGYGIVAGRASAHGRIVGLTSRGGRHAFTTASIGTEVAPQHWSLHDCLSTEAAFTSFDTHPGCRFIEFIDCISHNVGDNAGNGHGIHARGPDVKVINPIVIGANQGVAFVDGSDRGVVQGGVLRNCKVGVLINDSDKVSIGAGLRIERPREYGILCEAQSAAWTGHMTQQTIGDVTITGEPSQFAIKQADTHGAVEVDLNRVKIPDLAQNKWFSGIETFTADQLEERQRAHRLLVSGVPMLRETVDRAPVDIYTLTGSTENKPALYAIHLRKGDRISNIVFLSGGTGITTKAETHQYAALLSFSATNPKLLAVSSDKGTASWSANSLAKFEVAEPYVVPASGLYFVALLIVNATTPPTLAGINKGQSEASRSPILNGTGPSAITTFPAELGEPAGRAGLAYAGVT